MTADEERIRCGGNALADRAAAFIGEREREQAALDEALEEALDLLALWYGRWQGFVAGTPDDMQVRTRELLERAGRPPRGTPVQR